MLKCHVSSFVFLPMLVVVSTPALAVNFVAGAGVSVKRVDFAFDTTVTTRTLGADSNRLNGEIQQKVEFQSTQPFLQGVFVANFDTFYVGVNGETGVTLSDVDIDVAAQRSDGLTGIDVEPYSDEARVERTDLGISAGWRGIENTVLFFGYKTGETDFDDSRLSRSFSEHGPLLGASFTFAVDQGALTFGGAYATLDGTYDEGAATGAFVEDVDGDAGGFSVFANWSAPLTQQLRYVIDLRWQRYKFDGDQDGVCSTCTNGTVNPQSVLLARDFSVEETIYGVSASILYALD